jgi:DNA-directed RNA polymerase specialized sigma24 family protein
MRRTTGDRATFEERFAVLAALGYKVAYRLTGDRVESEDLAQEALARAYLRWRKVAAYDEAWVARVTTNLAIGRWRKHGRVVVASPTSSAPRSRAPPRSPPASRSRSCSWATTPAIGPTARREPTR